MFQKGVSGNPGGRPKSKLKELVAKHTRNGELLVTKMVDIVKDPESANRDKIAAASLLADRLEGKAIQTSDVTVREAVPMFSLVTEPALLDSALIEESLPKEAPLVEAAAEGAN